jgi:hypothetical protein
MYSKEFEQLLSSKYNCIDINNCAKQYIEENFNKLIINIPKDYTPEFYNKTINNIDFDIVSKGDKLLLHSYNLFSRLLFLYNFNKTFIFE